MSNWKERAEAELAAQRVIEGAREIEGEQLRAKAAERLKIGLSLLEELDFSGKLADINTDILNGDGEIKAEDVVIGGKQYGRFELLVPSKYVEVTEKTEPVYERRYGHYQVKVGEEVDIWQHTPNNAGTVGIYEDRVGWQTFEVGKKIIGWNKRPKFPMLIIYDTTGSFDSKIGIEAESGYAKQLPTSDTVYPDTGWRMTQATSRYNTMFRMVGDDNPRNHFRGDSNAPQWKRYYTEIIVPNVQSASQMLGVLVESVLLQACINLRKKFPDDFFQEMRAEDDARIRDIQSRVGQVRPIR